MTPHGLALRAYIEGRSDAQLTVRRDDGVEDPLPVSHFFRAPEEFSPIEIAALEQCRGHILDVGAGSGLHSLVLQARGLTVTAIDISPQAVEIMAQRGVLDARCSDACDFEGDRFDTLLMLGHGIGMVENITGLDRFLGRARGLVASDGRWLLESLDVRGSQKPDHLAYQESNRAAGRYVGEIRMQFEYDGHAGPLFGWLHVDAETLGAHAAEAGWECEVVVEQENGEYLASLTRA
jgi:SAM-dependent methyltransferase